MTRGTLDRTSPPRPAAAGKRVRPVMLLTLNVELEEPAIEFAIESAAQAGAELYICDAVPLEFRPYVAHVARQWAEQMNRKHLDAVARRARKPASRRASSRSTTRSLSRPRSKISRTEQIGMLVFGASRRKLGKRTFRKAVKRIRENPPCLVWIDDS